MLMNICKWQRKPEKENGVLVACDQQQEWLLEWWWERYSAGNAFPVAFVDLGLTPDARKWCQLHGEVIDIDIDASFAYPKEDIYPHAVHNWEELCDSSFWKEAFGKSLPIAQRHGFKKPLACLCTPYQNSVWIDLDCEILGPIDDLFSSGDRDSEIALVRDLGTKHLPNLHPDISYNSSVIAFRHGAEIIRIWAEKALMRKCCFWREDIVLSLLICKLQCPVIDLPTVYNWQSIWALNTDAIIYHWGGTLGNNYIKKFRGIKPAFQAFHRALKE